MDVLVIEGWRWIPLMGAKTDSEKVMIEPAGMLEICLIQT